MKYIQIYSALNRCRFEALFQVPLPRPMNTLTELMNHGASVTRSSGQASGIVSSILTLDL